MKIIREYTFMDYTELRSIILPVGLTELGERAFYGCGVSQIEFPDSLKVIGPEAFARSKLKSFIAPAGLRILAYGAFAQCFHLKYAVLNDGLEILGMPGVAG